MYLFVAILLFLIGIGVTVYVAREVYRKKSRDDADVGFALGMGTFLTTLAAVGWPILLPMGIIVGIVYGIYVLVMRWIKETA